MEVGTLFCCLKAALNSMLVQEKNCDGYQNFLWMIQKKSKQTAIDIIILLHCLISNKGKLHPDHI